MMEHVITWGSTPGMLKSWHRIHGSLVIQGDPLIETTLDNIEIKAMQSGILHCDVSANTIVEPGQTIGRIICCTHDVLAVNNQCITCGVVPDNASSFVLSLRPSSHPVKRRVDVVNREYAEKKRWLLSHKKLLLILDLDQTVMHAMPLTSEKQCTVFDIPAFATDVYGFELPGTSLRYLVKFRPGLREFLLAAHELYQIHIYTLADYAYASEVLNLIQKHILKDVPSHILEDIFGWRIITRSHIVDYTASQPIDPATLKKNVNHVIGDSDLVVIMDDSRPVWANYIENLIHIHRYEYWVEQKPTPTFSASMNTSIKTTPDLTNNHKKRVLDHDTNIDDSDLRDTMPRLSNDENSAHHLSPPPVKRKATLRHFKPTPNVILDAKQAQSTHMKSVTRPSGICHPLPEYKPFPISTVPSPDNNDVKGELIFPNLQCHVDGEHDTVLESMLCVLRNIHTKFYKLPPWSWRRQVRLILPPLQSSVLYGCFIRYPGLSISALTNDDCDFLERVHDFGARVIVGDERDDDNDAHPTDDPCTHIISLQIAPTHALQLRSSQNAMPFHVTPSWLENSMKHWHCQNEIYYT